MIMQESNLGTGRGSVGLTEVGARVVGLEVGIGVGFDVLVVIALAGGVGEGIDHGRYGLAGSGVGSGVPLKLPAESAIVGTHSCVLEL